MSAVGAENTHLKGLNGVSATARRYHWHSVQLSSFIDEPHVGVCGVNQGLILNLTHTDASATRDGLVQITLENPDKMLREIRKIVMPRHHEVTRADVNLKRLGAVLTVAHETQTKDFESLLLLEGAGPRTIQSLTLVSEIIYGTPSRFADPARYSFAHGGKDGHPFPVPLKVYDETIAVLKNSIEKAKVGMTEKQKALQQLSSMARKVEESFVPRPFFEEIVDKEREDSYKHGGMTVMGKAHPLAPKKGEQLNLF